MGEESRFPLAGIAPKRYERLVAPIMAPFGDPPVAGPCRAGVAARPPRPSSRPL